MEFWRELAERAKKLMRGKAIKRFMEREFSENILLEKPEHLYRVAVRAGYYIADISPLNSRGVHYSAAPDKLVFWPNRRGKFLNLLFLAHEDQHRRDYAHYFNPIVSEIRAQRHAIRLARKILKLAERGDRLAQYRATDVYFFAMDNLGKILKLKKLIERNKAT